MNLNKAYKLGHKKKVVVDYLEGKITQTEAAARLGMKRQQLPTVVSSIIRYLVMTERIDIKDALKHY